MSAVLHVGKQKFGVDELISLLTSPQILPQLLRELLVEQAIADVAYTQDELDAYQAKLADDPRAAGSAQSRERFATRQLKLEKFKEERWGSQIDAQFQSQREHLDRVLFSIVQTQDVEVIQELYFRLQEEEANFAQLATQYSQGPEAQTNGLVGPMEVRNLNPKLARVLRASQPGQISPPFRVDQWVAIARLERYLPAALDRATRQRLLDEAFERWLQAQLQQQAQAVYLERPSEPAALPPSGNADATASTAQPAAAPDPQPPATATASAPPPQRPLAPATAARPERSRTAATPPRLAPSDLHQELQQRRGSRLPEALMLSLVPIAVGGWSIYALFSFGNQTSPFTPTAPVEQTAANTNEPAPHPDFHAAVNHANRAAELTQTAQTRAEWETVAESWQAAIAGMEAVPGEAARADLARRKVDEYGVYLEYAREQASDPDVAFRAAVRRALRATEAAGAARSTQDWIQVAQDWAQAADLMQVVETSSPNYELAQTRIPRYQTYRDYAREQASLSARLLPPAERL